MAGEKIFQARAELKRMAKTNLLKMAFSQKEKNCLLGGACPYLLEYHSTLFCVSEIMGQGCQSEKIMLLSTENRQNEREISEITNKTELPVGSWLPGFG